MAHKPLKRVLIMAGGTGGHVFPGLAVARYLRDKGVDVHWLGTNQGLEARVVPEEKLPLHLVNIGGLRGKGIKPLLAAPLKVTAAVRESMHIIRQVDPDVVIGMGGFVSGPGGIASWLTRRPLVIHEQNAKAGFTNKILARFANRVLTGFPDVFTSQSKFMTIGNPIRAEIANLGAPDERLATRGPGFRLLVLGGSLGAQALNDVVPRALSYLTPGQRPEVIHQTGEKHFEETKNIYQLMQLQANVQPFIKDMAQVYSWADLVICRAGALTIAELCGAGVGAIFVPYPFAVDDHQTANAQFMVRHDAALCIQQNELTEARLADIVSQFSQSPAKRVAMARAAYQLRKVNVAERIFDILSEVVSRWREN